MSRIDIAIITIIILSHICIAAISYYKGFIAGFDKAIDIALKADGIKEDGE